ncbi:MAG: hypothetical protein OHK0017_13760 [Patescibacteria group bacterium]
MPLDLASGDRTSKNNSKLQVEVINDSNTIKQTDTVETRSAVENFSENQVNNSENYNGQSDLQKIKARNKRNRGKVMFIVVALLGIFTLVTVVAGAMGYGILSDLNSNSFGQDNSGGNDLISQITKINPFKQNNDEINSIKGAQEGRINILLLGKGGSTHTAGNLTDSQILVSIFPKEKKIAMMNFPRDIYVKDGYMKKLNAVYADAESSAKGTGARKLATILESELNTKIQYWATIDFNGFKSLVDAVGGVEVDVPNGFTDAEYPDNQMKGYLPPQTFKTGPQSMNGDRALIYARSRHGSNGEASDFARSVRQRIVITAIVDKAVKTNVATDLDKITKISKAISENFRTSLELSETLTLGKSLKEYDLKNNVYSWTLDSGGDIFCASNSQETGYILQYCDGAVFGSVGSRVSKSRTALQDGFADILNVSTKDKLNKSTVAIVANKNKSYQTVYNAVAKYKSGQILGNNQYKEIAGTTSSSSSSGNSTASSSKITVYSKSGNDDILNYLLSRDLGFQFERGGELPASKVLPKNMAGAEIIFWIE